jgi:hypothetical protein
MEFIVRLATRETIKYENFWNLEKKVLWRLVDKWIRQAPHKIGEI